MTTHSFSDLVLGRLPKKSKFEKCQFCGEAADVLICNLQGEPTFWMCDVHALRLANILIEAINSRESSEPIIRWIKEQEKKKKEERKMEKQALHV